MATETIGVLDARVALVSDRRYARVVRGMIERAQCRVWASVFLVDFAHSDPALTVLGVLHELAAARWRGADVRLLIGGSRTNLEMAEGSATALAVARRLGVQSRWLTSRNRRGSHAKYVVADDEVLVGSHNWSPSAFLHSKQDSVFVRSPELAGYLADAFGAQWTRRPATTA